MEALRTEKEDFEYSYLCVPVQIIYGLATWAFFVTKPTGDNGSHQKDGPAFHQTIQRHRRLFFRTNRSQFVSWQHRMHIRRFGGWANSHASEQQNAYR